jgi:hypothetical protein
MRAKEPDLAHIGRSSQRICGVSHGDSKLTATGGPSNNSDSAAHSVSSLLRRCRKGCKINAGPTPRVHCSPVLFPNPSHFPFPRSLCEITGPSKLHRRSYLSTNRSSKVLRLRDRGGVLDCYQASIQQLNPAPCFRSVLKRPNHGCGTAPQSFMLSHSRERPAIYSLPPETGALVRDAATASVRADWDTGMR